MRALRCDVYAYAWNNGNSFNLFLFYSRPRTAESVYASEDGRGIEVMWKYPLSVDELWAIIAWNDDAKAKVKRLLGKWNKLVSMTFCGFSLLQSTQLSLQSWHSCSWAFFPMRIRRVAKAVTFVWHWHSIGSIERKLGARWGKTQEFFKRKTFGKQ